MFKKNPILIFTFLFLTRVAIGQSAPPPPPPPPNEFTTTNFSFEKEGTVMKVNYFSNYPLEEINDKIDRLVVVVHGTNRNPKTYFNNMLAAAELDNSSLNTVIISPGFIMERDLASYSEYLGDEHIFWTNAGWKQGDESVKDGENNPRSQAMSSFEVMDSIVYRALKTFPKIKAIVISGNSAGGQYVNRYAGGNLIHDSVLKNFKIEMKYLVAAPSTYTYLTAERPVVGSPGKYFTPSDTSCNSSYNSYRHGMDNLNNYMSITGGSKIKTQYGQRKIAYFVGGNDNDPMHSSLDKTCQAMLQGRERKERAELFMLYLEYLYGKKQSLTIVENVGHDHAKMFASENGRKWLFH